MFDLAWKEIEIGECLESTFAGEWGMDPNPENARVLRANDINNEGIISAKGGASRRVPVSKIIAKALKPGDIILEGSGGSPDQPVGRVAYFSGAVSGVFLCSNFFRTLCVRQSVADSRFLFWKLMWFYKQPQLLTFQQQTTGIINLKFEEYKKAKILLPASLNEQQKIAEVLDILDIAIQKTSAIIEKLKQVKQGLLHDLLTRGVDANGELRPSYEQAPHLYQASPLGWIPKKWKTGALNEWLLGNPKNGYSPREAGRWTGTQMLGLACLTQDGFLPLQLKPAPVHDKKLESAMLADGDLLISRANTRELVGLVGIYRDVGTPCTYPDLMMRLTPSIETSAAFLKLVLQSASSRRQIQAFASGTSSSMVKISGVIVANLAVAMPLQDEQRHIISQMNSIQERLNNESELFSKSLVMKQGLMEDLLTGRVRVTALLQEVEEAAHV